MNKNETKRDRKAWAIAIAAAGITLLAQGLVEILALTGHDSVRWFAPIVFSAILILMAFKIMPELKGM